MEPPAAQHSFPLVATRALEREPLSRPCAAANGCERAARRQRPLGDESPPRREIAGCTPQPQRQLSTMGGSSKLDKLKAMQKEGKKGIVVDKTFGLKNKNKSKKVQQFCKQVQETQNKNKGIDGFEQEEEEDD